MSTPESDTESTTPEESVEDTSVEDTEMKTPPLGKSAMAPHCVICARHVDPEPASKVPRPCLNCEHIYCPECLAAWFRDACRDESHMPPKCHGILPLRAVAPYLTQEEILIYIAKFQEWDTLNRFYCPVQTCSAFIPPQLMPEPPVPADLPSSTSTSPASNQHNVDDKTTTPDTTIVENSKKHKADVAEPESSRAAAKRPRSAHYTTSVLSLPSPPDAILPPAGAIQGEKRPHLRYPIYTVDNRMNLTGSSVAPAAGQAFAAPQAATICFAGACECGETYGDLVGFHQSESEDNNAFGDDNNQYHRRRYPRVVMPVRCQHEWTEVIENSDVHERNIIFGTKGMGCFGCNYEIMPVSELNFEVNNEVEADAEAEEETQVEEEAEVEKEVETESEPEVEEQHLEDKSLTPTEVDEDEDSDDSASVQSNELDIGWYCLRCAEVLCTACKDISMARQARRNRNGLP
ncbi:MAG: hypothetical protein M4579_006699 [Chaenotheca gracillima]|nr:MAG: hypothetical protein M4579_006699 [Chaenotheca gracillima]